MGWSEWIGWTTVRDASGLLDWLCSGAMSAKTTLAWIGTAHIHTPGFVNQANERGASAAGVWDHDAARAAMNAEKLNCEVKSLAQLAEDPEVNGFVVCSETNRHLELVQELVKTGKPIFVEKPMGPDGETSRAILAAFESSQSLFHTGYFMRGVPAVQTLKKKVAEGFFGQITRVRGSVCHSGALGGWFDGEWRWMADRSQAGVGGYGDLGTHALDLLLWIFGDVETATGLIGMGTARYPGCDETGEGLLKFRNGIIGTLTAAWDDVTNPAMITVSGTKGYASLGDSLMLAGPDGKLEKLEELEPQVPSGFGAFLDFLEGKPADLVTAQEACMRDRVMSAIYRGAETQTWVTV
jgi:predicted dehydrogenase